MTAIIECPEHGDLCGGPDCCCADLHVGPTWKDAHDALSVYVSALVGASTLSERNEVFRRYTAIREALAESENGRSET